MKKQRTFAQRWNTTALRRILKQLKASHPDMFLCNASPEFSSLWSDHKAEIKALAREFNDPHAAILDRDYNKVLFYPPDTLSYEESQAWQTNHFRRLRIDFLTNEIKRLTTKA